MSKQKQMSRELIPVHPVGDVTILAPNAGVVGKFLEDVHNMFKARAMRMTSLLRQIDESGQRTEHMLRMASERMKAAESRLELDLQKQGLVAETDQNNGTEE